MLGSSLPSPRTHFCCVSVFLRSSTDWSVEWGPAVLQTIHTLYHQRKGIMFCFSLDCSCIIPLYMKIKAALVVRETSFWPKNDTVLFDQRCKNRHPTDIFGETGICHSLILVGLWTSPWPSVGEDKSCSLHHHFYYGTSVKVLQPLPEVAPVWWCSCEIWRFKNTGIPNKGKTQCLKGHAALSHDHNDNLLQSTIW